MADCRAKAENMQDKCGAPYDARKFESAKKNLFLFFFFFLKDRACQKDKGVNLKVLYKQSWNNVTKKQVIIILDYNWKNKINIHESIVI